MTGEGFPPGLRLHETPEYQRVYGRKRSVSDALLIVYACESDRPHPRLGLSVGRKFGKAHERNRFKRRMREAFRRLRPDLAPGVDFVVVPRPAAKGAEWAELRESLRVLAAQGAGRLRR